MSRRIIFITLSVPVFALCGMFIMVLAYLSCSESYNPFVPYADTRFAAGYTAEKFDRVKPGMSHDEVYTLLGQPLIIDTLLNGKGISLWYSDDGKLYHEGHQNSLVNDFAWYSVSILLNREGRVIDIFKGWQYD
jgi:hypothetical protein